MEKTPYIIITLFSADNVRLDDESFARVLDGDYPIRVKSKVLATIREICAESHAENVVGFLPITRESWDIYQKYPVPFPEDVTQDHYGDLALYLSPEAPCRIVSNLLSIDKDGALVCRDDVVRGHVIVVISDKCSDWSATVSLLTEAGAISVKCISILKK